MYLPKLFNYKLSHTKFLLIYTFFNILVGSYFLSTQVNKEKHSLHATNPKLMFECKIINKIESEIEDIISHSIPLFFSPPIQNHKNKKKEN